MAVTRNATPVAATLLAGSVADEHDNVIRYDWTEYAVIVDWNPGHEQFGEKQTRTVLGSMTLVDAQTEAGRAKAMLVDKLRLAAKVTLKHQTRTCTIETTYTPDTHEDGDGTPRRHTRTLAGSLWANYRETDRALWREANDAEKALSVRAAA